MIFEQLLFQAKEGDLESITDILNMYRPLLLKYSVIDGRLDEDLYQEQCITLMEPSNCSEFEFMRKAPRPFDLGAFPVDSNRMY